jgi:hypothetical protein
MILSSFHTSGTIEFVDSNNLIHYRLVYIYINVCYRSKGSVLYILKQNSRFKDF